MSKAKFKRHDTFFHPEQKLFVVVDDIVNVPNKGNLYTLKVFTHGKSDKAEYKRYYEDKVIDVLNPLKRTNAVKILYGE